MKNKEKQYSKWLEQMFNKYKSVLFIEKYHFKDTKKKDGYLASEFNYPYLDINILWTEKSMSDWQHDKQDAERRLIHEFCHTITDPFYCVCNGYHSKEQIENERERLTDHIASIVNKHFNLL